MLHSDGQLVLQSATLAGELTFDNGIPVGSTGVQQDAAGRLALVLILVMVLRSYQV